MVKIPNRFEDLYPGAVVEKLLDALQQPDISGKVRDALGRVGIKDVHPLEQVQHAWQQARSWLESLATDGGLADSPAMINATGQLLSKTNSRIPLSTSVAHAYASAAVQFHDAERVQQKVQKATAGIFGGAAVGWHASVGTGLHDLIADRQVIVAKSDLSRIAGLGDVGAMLHGLDVVEIGASNGCSREDWQQGLNAGSHVPKCILLVSPNGLDAESAAQLRQDAVQQARAADVPVFELLADAVLNTSLAEQLGFPAMRNRLETDAVIAPLHLFLGGPTGAITVGKEAYVLQAQRSAKLSGNGLAGPEMLASIVALQISHSCDVVETGTLACLLRNAENLKNRASRVAIQVNGNGLVVKAREVERTSALGASPWDRYRLPSWAVEIRTEGNAEEFRRRLQTGQLHTKSESRTDSNFAGTPISCLGDHEITLLDLRFVDPKDDYILVEMLSPSHESPTADAEIVD